jgi:hypothetical protein
VQAIIAEPINHFSKTKKLDGIRSWSLEARVTCPGSVDSDACKGCYATTGQYNFSNVKKVRMDNKLAWQQENWISLMVTELNNERFFRWFDSGDCYSLKLAEKILEVMKLTPWVYHWMPTRMYKFNKFMEIFDKMNELPNVVVRFSSDSITGQIIEGTYTSTIFPDGFEDPRVYKCPATLNRGKCTGCRECWSKDRQVVGFKQHGEKMKKVFKDLQK